MRHGDRSFFVPVSDIDWIEASQNHLLLHAGEDSHIVRGTLAGLADQLDPARFARIHRGH
ncbi:MAG: LytR/AlgR family response regulator transcription factor [Longimicrobiales bacterium]